MSSNYISVAFINTYPTLYFGQIENIRSMWDAQFYLAIRVGDDARQSDSTVDRLLRLTKISSADIIDTVIGSALPGVLMSYLDSPPKSLPPRPGFRYFRIETTGIGSAYWRGIESSGRIAVRIPCFDDISLELFIVPSVHQAALG